MMYWRCFHGDNISQMNISIYIDQILDGYLIQIHNKMATLLKGRLKGIHTGIRTIVTLGVFLFAGTYCSN